MLSIKKSHLKNGDALEWKSKIVEDFDADEPADDAEKSADDAKLPNQLSVYLSANKDGPHRTSYVFIENAILRVQKFKQDFEVDKAPILIDEETRIYEYPDAKGNPILRGGSGIVLELVADPTTTNPTTTEEITTVTIPTTTEEVTTTSQETNPTEVNADTTPEPKTPTTGAPSEEATTDAATNAPPVETTTPSVETTTLPEDEPEATTPSGDAVTEEVSQTPLASDVTTTCKDV